MTAKKLTVLALLVALCAVGGFIKIPSPTGTVALDSLPGFLGAALFGGWGGAVVGFLGHLFSAATVAFPFGIAIHLYVGVQMAVYVSIFGYLYRKGYKIPAVIAGVALNGVVAPLLLVPIYGSGFFLAMLPSLSVGSAVNIVLAAALAQVKVLQRMGEDAAN
ncbi:MAG: ECF transporter S component [Bacillota bacterium]|nr:ECF transporter S component [Bacillota bacterium]HHU30524.1 ECF transporter S component [Bacillota bacterium]